MATVDTGTGHFRLPADRRSAARPGPSLHDPDDPEDPWPAVQALLEAIVLGDLDSLDALLTGTARGVLARLLVARGKAALSASLKARAGTLLDCRLERRLEIADGTVECRLRLFSLEPGGGIRSCCWVVQARLQGGTWRISGLDRIPGAEACEAVDSPRPLRT